MSGQKSWKPVFAVLLIVIPIALLGWVGYKMWYTDQLRVAPPDYCPTPTGPQEKRGFVVRGHTAILIDTSNKISKEDAKQAFKKIESWARDRDSEAYIEKLFLYGLPESKEQLPAQSKGSSCIPKDGAEYDPIYENRVFVEAQFRQFLATLKPIFRDLVDREEAAQSPILETMAHLVQRDTMLNSIVLVSDMLQNTPASDHYAKVEGDTRDIPSTCREITGLGQLKTVYVYYIDRERPEIQPSEWPDPWWRECLRGVEQLVEMN